MITFYLDVIALVVFLISGVIMLQCDEIPKSVYSCTWISLIACLVRSVSSYGL